MCVCCVCVLCVVCCVLCVVCCVCVCACSEGALSVAIKESKEQHIICETHSCVPFRMNMGLKPDVSISQTRAEMDRWEANFGSQDLWLF